MRTAWLSLVLMSLSLGLVAAARIGAEPAPGPAPIAAVAAASAPGRVRVEVRVLPTGTPPVTPIIIPTGGPTGEVTPSTVPPSNLGETVTVRPSGSAPVVPSATVPPTTGGATGAEGVLPIRPPATEAVVAGGMPRTGVPPDVLAWLAIGAGAVVAGLALVLVARRRRARTG